MNKLSVIAYPAIAVLSLAAAFVAHAETPTVDDSASQVWSQTKTRAQVQTELQQARADGSIRFTSISYNPLALAKSLKTRDEVRAETLAARASGEADALVAEDGGALFAQRRQARDASQVLAGNRAGALR